LSLVVSLVFNFTLLSHSVFGQDTARYYYADSTVSAKGILLDGKPHGLWINYFPDGNLKSMGRRNHGLLDSTWTFYFENGLIKETIQYRNGIKNGYNFKYSIEDNHHFLKEKILYIDDKKQGKYLEYFADGDVQKVITYKNGYKEGEELFFNQQNEIETVLVYTNGQVSETYSINKESSNSPTIISQIIVNNEYEIEKVIGKSNNQDTVVRDFDTFVDQKSKKRKYTIQGLEDIESSQDTLNSGQFRDKIPIGTHYRYNDQNEIVEGIVYDSIGRVFKKYGYKNGVYQGDYLVFYSDSTIKVQGKFHIGSKNGLWTYFFPGGKVEQQGYFHNDKLHKKWIWYFQSSDTARIEHYRYGERDGLYVSYDPYGEIVKKGLYIAGKKQEGWIENTFYVLFEGDYFDGEKEGQWRGIYNDGTLAYEGNYVRGKKHREHVFYYFNGNVRKVEQYHLGHPDGFWKYYHKNGELNKIVSYKRERQLYIK
jgi:antitoxin component YwqK of YwqJK toxin-antitoxin module